MAEIKIERKQRSLMPWVLALVLLVLVIWGVAKAMDRRPAASPGARSGASAADTVRDDMPPRLRQYA